MDIIQQTFAVDEAVDFAFFDTYHNCMFAWIGESLLKAVALDCWRLVAVHASCPAASHSTN